MTSGGTIQVELHPPIAELVLARPQARNAMDERMSEDFERAVELVRSDERVRVVLVRGRGLAFSAGGDFSFIEARTRDDEAANREAMLRFYGRFLSVRRLPVPTIAVLHGAAIGAGLCLALACDLRIAARGTRLAASFVRIGLHPGMGATALLPAIVGPAVAAELLLTGRRLDADEAHRLGLVNVVVPSERLREESLRIAERIATAAPQAVRQTVQSLRAPLDERLQQALEREARCQAVNYGTREVLEGIAAFRERRPARFESPEEPS